MVTLNEPEYSPFFFLQKRKLVLGCGGLCYYQLEGLGRMALGMEVGPEHRVGA